MKDMSKRILLARCQNCEEQIQRQGKRCAWRSLGNDYCFEGMSNEEANATRKPAKRCDTAGNG